MVVSAAAELPVQSVMVIAGIFFSSAVIIALLQIGAEHEQLLLTGGMPLLLRG